MQSKGLGDSIEKLTEVTGIKKIVGDDCGCAKRRDALNRIFPYQNKE